jgi:cystathionine beta-lyase/cystathionine gamma-synthase
MPDDEKDKRGIDEHLIRLSIGIEDYKDINITSVSLDKLMKSLLL